MSKFLKIGHRGANGYEPENTLKSFKKAIKMGADAFELDVHLSVDGELIVIHDETIDRTTNGKGAVKNLTLTQLKSFRIDKTNEIPTLDEALQLMNNRILVNIELKSKETVEKVILLVEKHIKEKGRTQHQFLVSSFEWDALEDFSTKNKNIPLGVLTETDLDAAIAFAIKIKAKSIHPDFNMLTAENVKVMQSKGFKVYPWTVNENSDIARMKSFGVDGIITDFIDRI